MDASRDSSVELSFEECRELLLTQSVGRVAFSSPDGVRIVPVNFALRDGSVEFRTTSYSELATHAPGTRVAFEVDQLDPAHRSGWSVIVTGDCERVLEHSGSTLSGSTRSGSAPGGDADPWAGGRRQLVLRLHAHQMTGRRVGGGEWDHPPADLD
ncbi:pyridoxamine 5'-phosphate oxidase family protein [Nocardioides gilvus]|uniref:pyridoxamine 5'-phosphate oxidase family protein n=1 Tax=Nocardioides gilvus TaxID=1735589 RepID=UPI000D7436C9|nr:pyridoxamine 5'-phosphate oxidase family protein [Nocardioides gilvus]